MITSTANPLIKSIRKLRQKKYRAAENAFFAEGLRTVFAAIETQAPVQKLIRAPELLSSAIALEKLASLEGEGVPSIDVSAKVFSSISMRDNPTGLGAIIAENWTSLDEMPAHNQAIWAALVNIGDPGNLGTIIRTVDAVSGDGVILAGQGTDPYHPSAVKASMGSLFAVPLCRVDSAQTVLNWTKERGFTTVATSAHAKHSYSELSYSRPLMLLFGSEGEGLSDEILRSCDYSVSIPMKGLSSSLNLSVAAGILLYEASRNKLES